MNDESTAEGTIKTMRDWMDVDSRAEASAAVPCSIFRRGAVWMIANRACQSVAREVTERVMMEAGLNHLDFKLRDRLVTSIADDLNRWISSVADK